MGQLDRSPRSNWIEREGGLPDFIARIAVHLVNERGFTVSRAVATAVSTCKRWCATGEVHQWQGVQIINSGSRAQACAAAAEWERMRASARAKRG